MATAKNRKNSQGVIVDKSEPIPTAHTTTQCAGGNSLNSEIHGKYASILRSQNLSDADKAVIELLYLNGLRISEVLALTYNDIRSDGSLFIRGLKGSSNRIVYTRNQYSCLSVSISSNELIFHNYNRFYFHRLFKRLGIYQPSVGSDKMIVTHIFRHNYISQLQKDFNDLELTRKSVGHRSEKSTLHYINKNKGAKSQLNK